jgi:nicotinate phosphoribosyltransferase
MSDGPRERLDPEVFELPVEKIRDGYYTDAYFNHTRSSLLADGRHPRVLMQVFQKKAPCSAAWTKRSRSSACSHGWDGLDVRALHDGDRSRRGDRADDRRRLHALLSSGDGLSRRARAEDARLDERARRSSGRERKILYFPARHDHPRPDGRRLRRARRRGDRRLDGRPGLVVGRPRHRDRATRLIAPTAGTPPAARTFAQWAPTT